MLFCRKMIVCGCVAFAKHVGSVRLESELLPQCWEQITHKYHERRLLVAECCGALAPYIPVSGCHVITNCGIIFDFSIQILVQVPCNNQLWDCI